MHKILTIVGARPQFIKAAAISHAIKNLYPSEITEDILHTGQHYDDAMSGQFFTELNIPQPRYNLGVGSGSHGAQTAAMLKGTEEVLLSEHYDGVLVYGDTNSTLAGALAAAKLQLPVYHVEAGLRTGNIYSPWPEEMNRQITGRIASFDFAPTPLNRNNLLKENVPDSKITVTGNTVIDALHMVVERIRNDKGLADELHKSLMIAGYDTDRLTDGHRMVLITGHRRENYGDGFINICNAIKDLSIKYRDVDFIYPMHLNPNVRKPIHQVFGENLDGLSNMFFIEPLGYLSFVYLMEKSYLVLTDSGGIQEEAPGLSKPVLVMRDTTERPEALESGTVRLVGTDYGKIVNEVSMLIDDEEHYRTMSNAVNPYGDGKASGRIVDFVRNNI